MNIKNIFFISLLSLAFITPLSTYAMDDDEKGPPRAAKRKSMNSGAHRPKARRTQDSASPGENPSEAERDPEAPATVNLSSPQSRMSMAQYMDGFGGQFLQRFIRPAA